MNIKGSYFNSIQFKSIYLYFTLNNGQSFKEVLQKYRNNCLSYHSEHETPEMSSFLNSVCLSDTNILAISSLWSLMRTLTEGNWNLYDFFTHCSATWLASNSMKMQVYLIKWTCKWHNTSSDDSINLIFNSKTAQFNTLCEEVFLIHYWHTNSVTHTGFSFNSGFFSLQHKTNNLLKLMFFFCCTSFGLFFQNGELQQLSCSIMKIYHSD